MSATVLGSVVRSDSLLPVEGVEIEARGGPAGEARTARTDRAGAFCFADLRAGRWTIRYREAGGASGEDAVELLPFVAASIQFELPMLVVVPGGRPAEPYGGKMTREGIVRVKVVERDGRPVPDASVTVLKAAGPIADIGHVTDAAGEVDFGGLVAGGWAFQALAPDGRRGDAGIELAEGEAASLTIRVGY